jgi:hypothetical protein
MLGFFNVVAALDAGSAWDNCAQLNAMQTAKVIFLIAIVLKAIELSVIIKLSVGFLRSGDTLLATL